MCSTEPWPIFTQYQAMKNAFYIRDIAAKKHSNSDFKTMGEEAVGKRIAVNKQKRSLSLNSHLEQNPGPGTYQIPCSFSVPCVKLKFPERNFPHQKISSNNLGPGSYNIPSTINSNGPQKHCNFNCSPRPNALEISAAQQLKNPCVGQYHFENKLTKKSFSLFHYFQHSSPDIGVRLKLPAKEKIHEEPKSEIKKQFSIPKNYFGKGERFKERKKFNYNFDHRKYSKIFDWTQKKNYLTIQSKRRQPSIYND